ncbi:MAG: glycosyltransferase family 2 protein [Lentisphaeria bacterium]|nr:glycosyltransferase family 2 protein [Lentisphaeria bacterium]
MDDSVRKKCAAVICVYNNGTTIRNVVEKVLLQHCGITVVVDDGSTDVCMQEVLSSLPVILLQHKVNQGKGMALQTALQFLASLPEEKKVDYMITLDADDQHEPSDMTLFFPVLAERKDLIICGCRAFRENVPWRSKLGRFLSNFFIRMETGVKISDTQSGFRAYPVALASEIICKSIKYDWETEMLVKLLRSGAVFREVAVQVYYLPAEERVSHFHVWKDNFRIVRLHGRLLFKYIFLRKK